MSLRHWLAGTVAVLVLAFPSATLAQSVTIEQLLALIAELQEQLAELLAAENEPFTWEVTDDGPLTVEFTYTVNQAGSCNGGAYKLYFGDEEDGEGPQAINFPADHCTAYVQHSVHEYEEGGSYTAKLYSDAGVMLGIATVVVETDDDEESDSEVTDVDIELSGDDHGDAPFDAVVTARIEAEKEGACPVDFPSYSLDWGDGTTVTHAGSQAVSTSGTSNCRQTLTLAFNHTFRDPGTYRMTFKAGGLSDSDTVEVIGDEADEDASCTVSASKTHVQSGESVTLTWNSENATSVTSWTGETVEKGSSMTVTPSKTTTYWFNVSGASGDKDSCSVTVYVDAETPRPTTVPSLTFRGAPASVPAGTAGTLTWSAADASSCTITSSEGQQWSVETSDSMSVYPYRETTYTLTCANSASKLSASKSVTLKVNDRPVKRGLEASALLSIESQLEAILKSFREVFGE